MAHFYSIRVSESYFAALIETVKELKKQVSRTHAIPKFTGCFRIMFLTIFII